MRGHVTKGYVPRLVEREMLSPEFQPNLQLIYKRYRKAADLVREYWRPESHVIDVGCGIGLSMLALRAVGIESTGLEVEEEFIEFAKSNFHLDVKRHDVLNTALEAKADVALMNSVLEHIAEPVEFLAGIRKVFWPEAASLS